MDASAAKIESDAIAVAEEPRKIERLARVAASVVRRGLADRARLVHTRVLSDTTFAVGLLLNGSQATSVLTKGPSAEKEEACEEFRQLWGSKSELRRFQDGSITESVVWTVARPEEASRIPSWAVEHLLSHHLGEVSMTTVSTNEEWLSILQVPESVRDAVNTEGSERLGFSVMMEEYDKLYKVLKNVDSELPLAILHVAPASELLRYSATFVPHPVDVARAASAAECISYMPVAEVTLQFESSPRWPDDLAAIQKLKLALLEKVASVAVKHLRGARINIALDANASDIDDSAAMEVLMPSGVAYRIRVHHEKERVLLQRALEPPPPGIPNQLPLPPRKLVTPALERNLMRFVHAPAHHHSLAPMHHRFPSFSTAVRLLKRWVAAHMLSSHLSAEALELLTARTYLDPGTLSTPASATAGFLRTLEFLASWDWRTTPVFVALHAVTRDAASLSGRPKFSEDARGPALAAFEKRGSDHEAWSLITEDDESGTRWTGRVGPLIAGRVAALARASLELVRNGTDEGDLDVSVSLGTAELTHRPYSPPHWSITMLSSTWHLARARAKPSSPTSRSGRLRSGTSARQRTSVWASTRCLCSSQTSSGCMATLFLSLPMCTADGPLGSCSTLNAWYHARSSHSSDTRPRRLQAQPRWLTSTATLCLRKSHASAKASLPRWRSTSRTINAL